ncbi:MAG: serine/threonine protein kinase [Myxococcales bacterium]|nr:serine/threonine protein kinase [Myxococcales bacterium]
MTPSPVRALIVDMAARSPTEPEAHPPASDDLDDLDTLAQAPGADLDRLSLPTVDARRPVARRAAPPAPGVVPDVAPEAAPLPDAPSTPSTAALQDDVAAVLHGEEVARARGWAAMLLVMAASTLAFTPTLPGDVAAKAPFVATVAGLSALSLWVIYRCRRPLRYTPTVFRVYAFATALGSIEIIHFLGPFSPTPLVVTLGISFFGLGRDRLGALIAPLVAITGYLAVAVLTLTGVLVDHGALTATSGTAAGRVMFTAMVPVVLLVALWMARLARSTLEHALTRAHEAALLANQREAQLVEVKRDLDQVLDGGAGAKGRLTGTAAGPWALAEIIGRGAMGEVYAARHRDDARAAAVKVLRELGPEEARLRERFVREGEVVATLRSPHIVRVFDTGVVAAMPYIAMERLDGEDLARRLRRTPRLERAALITLAREVARGLDVAHAAGVVHRDLKPHNLYWSRAHGAWKILDFGVASLVGSTGTLTQAAVVGTPGYMAPEQARGHAVDGRADVFALGAVLYRALTGRPAFTGVDTPQLLFAVVFHHPEAPSALVPSLPRAVDAVLAVALAKAATDRFAHATEFAEALTAALHGAAPAPIAARGAALIARHPWGRAASEA